MASEVPIDRAQLRTIFDEDAELYDRARPRYPEEIFDDLFKAVEAETVLEVGCGTGQASKSLLERGVNLTCVELGENLARLARQNLPRAKVVNAEFESLDTDERFDLVFAATSWHWLDPETRYAKAASLLLPAGHLAIINGGHAFPFDSDPFFEQMQTAYEAIGWKLPVWPPPDPEDLKPEIDASGLFETLFIKRYLWTTNYNAQEHINLLNTYSDHRALEPEKRQIIFDAAKDLMGSRRVIKHNMSILNVARLKKD